MILRILAFATALCSAQNTAPVPGARLYYTDSGGSGTPVVFLHPATGSVRIWEYQIPAFTAAGYRFIAYDRRGWGRTEVDINEPSTAADDLEALMTHLKISSFHLVGTAGGGIVALDYALSYPQRFISLTVADSIGGITDESFQELSRKLRPKEFDALPPHLKELGPTYRAANPAGTEKWLELEHVSRSPKPLAAAQPPKNRVTLALLRTITTPTLVIASGADLYAPPPLMKLFANPIILANPRSQFVSIPDAGHSAYWETPDQFNQTILKFLRQHKR